MSLWNEFIATLSEHEMMQIIDTYEELQNRGMIGDCVLRDKAQEWIEILGLRLSVVAIMGDIAQESYKHFAHKYLDMVNYEIR